MIAEIKQQQALLEYQTIMEMLEANAYNKSKVAKLLKIDRKSLYNKLKDYEKRFKGKDVPKIQIDKRVVPYQVCPKCNGDGHNGRYGTPSVLSTNAVPQCNVCHGAMVIPQHVINSQYEYNDIISARIQENESMLEMARTHMDERAVLVLETRITELKNLLKLKQCTTLSEN